MIDEHDLTVLYQYLCDYVATHQHPPTLREVAQAHYMSIGRADRCLLRLELRGWLYRQPGKARGMTLLRTCSEVNPAGESEQP